MSSIAEEHTTSGAHEGGSVVVKEVPVIKEVIKEVRVEVPKIVHVPVEVVREVPIEVIKYVDREVVKVVEKVCGTASDE